MRYMGAAADMALTGSGEALDPAFKQRMMIEASAMPDARAKDLLDIAENSPYGKRTKYLRLLEGAAVGAIAGYLLLRMARRRRR